MITICTPTFNRAYRLPALYDSLCHQTDLNFEWLIIDDGSTDQTRELVHRWISSSNQNFIIRYYYQVNKGKHSAINRAINLANGNVFFIVDSDDVLTLDAVQLINQYLSICNVEIAGVCFRKADLSSKSMIGQPFPQKEFISDSIELMYEHGILGDKAEVFYTSMLKEHPFPIFDNENFVPEALIWNRIADEHRLLCVDKVIYLCEYLPDGLSMGFNKNLFKNPKGFSLYYKECFKRQRLPTFYRFKYILRYIQCQLYIFLKLLKIKKE